MVGYGWGYTTLPVVLTHPTGDEDMELTEKEEAVSLGDFYRTNDMAMVTYLKISGHAVQRVLWEAGTCYWLFRASEFMLSQMEQFLSGQARIEPREFNRVFSHTKREFYDTNPSNVTSVGRR